jgi:hypothetical protein
MTSLSYSQTLLFQESSDLKASDILVANGPIVSHTVKIQTNCQLKNISVPTDIVSIPTAVAETVALIGQPTLSLPDQSRTTWFQSTLPSISFSSIISFAQCGIR